MKSNIIILNREKKLVRMLALVLKPYVWSEEEK